MVTERLTRTSGLVRCITADRIVTQTHFQPSSRQPRVLGHALVAKDETRLAV
jgi:hypothetical protein